MESFRIPSLDAIATESSAEQFNHQELAVCEEDMDVVNMTVLVRLKRKLVTGDPKRVIAPGEKVEEGKRGQEAESPLIFKCNVRHEKSCAFQNRLRYLKGSDVLLGFLDRGKDYLMEVAHRVNVDPMYYRQHALEDAFVLGAVMCYKGEPKMPASFGSMGPNDFVHSWVRDGAPGAKARMYSTPAGDHIIHPAVGRNVYLEEMAQYNILFAQPVAEDHNQHGNLGFPGPGDPPCLPPYWYYPVTHWSTTHWVDNAFKP